ncbi:MAG: hypothetical protein Kow0090_08190 [Myxococcota bacterium]
MNKHNYLIPLIILSFLLASFYGCREEKKGKGERSSDNDESGGGTNRGDAANGGDSDETDNSQSGEGEGENGDDIIVEQAKLTSVSPQELSEMLKNKDFLLINVHVPYYGEIPGTDTHIPYTEITELKKFIGASLDEKVVLYCLTDSMSANAGEKLVAEGYRAIKYLAGGMKDWEQAGYTLIK